MFGQEKPRRSGAKRTRVTLRNECFFGVFGSATIPQGLVPERKAPPDDGEMMTLRTLLEKSSDADLLHAHLHDSSNKRLLSIFKQYCEKGTRERCHRPNSEVLARERERVGPIEFPGRGSLQSFHARSLHPPTPLRP
jgi:hypothetical protein